MSASNSPIPNNTSSTDAPFDRRGYLTFIVFIAILGSFSSLVNDMYLPTVPAMMKEFHTSMSMTQLGISATMLGLGIGSVLWGSLSDRYGRKKILLISLGVFTVGTLAAIFSPTIEVFDSCRLLQGIGAGGSMVLSYSIPTDRYSGRNLTVIMALVGALNGFVPAAAPLVGGFMADDFGWRGIFMVLLGIGVIMWIWTTQRPESLPPSRRLQNSSIMIYIKAYAVLMRNGRFMTYVLTKSIGVGLLFSYVSSAPFILQTHYGMTASHFGLLFGANSVAMIVGSILVSKLKNTKRSMLIGGTVMCAGAVAEAVVLYLDGGIIGYEIAIVPMLFGSGMVFSTANALSMEEGRSDAGSASAILNVVKYIFAAIVTPLVGLGDIMRSTGIVFLCIALGAATFLIIASRLKPA
ncbi:MAG: multidrug effflux MFS transporter [Muribaculaceae bacterium]|nr:multidrug effflux MFS transporter [Muribaculaceae bacterium]